MAAEQVIIPFEAWKPKYVADKAIKLAKPMSATAYAPGAEQPPDMEWYQLDKHHIDNEIAGLIQKVKNCIVDPRPQDLELAVLQETLTNAEKVRFANVKGVGIVGQQAMGKSLLINALLHRRQLSKTSAAGGACTATAIKYVHKPGMAALSDLYDASVQFIDDVELNEIISEHARNYYTRSKSIQCTRKKRSMLPPQHNHSSLCYGIRTTMKNPQPSLTLF
jgi:hypothetical protein